MPKHWPACWSLDLPTLAEFRPHTGPPDTGALFDGVQLGGDAGQLLNLSAHPLTIGVVVHPGAPLAMPDPCHPFSGRAST